MAMDNTRPFLDWATKSGVWMDPDFEVSSSQYGGLGIFAMKDREEDAVILRIPHKCTFDMDNLLALSKNIGSEASELTGPVFRAVLSCGDLDTETSILRNYLWGFTIVQSICVKLGKQLQTLEEIKPYLQILQTTPVLNVDDSHDAQDQLVQALVLEKRRVRKTYEEICERISGFEFPFELAFQLHQAVKSRVLEIPHAIDDGEDFETNVTLVPVLDFANHQKNNNAVFDVDRSSGDVLLRLSTNWCVRSSVLSHNRRK
ncbi:cytochrome c lysine N-methyltransferase [Clavispora lusitaniae]|nr:cytochrome c lysine N-methyltransferase [Clavispora lusitaniae]